MTAGQYNDQAPALNWLQAISGDNGNLDPRTYQIHQTIAHFDNPLYTLITRQQSYARRNRLENWVRANQTISNATGFDPSDSWEVKSCNSSTESLVEELQIPIRLEAEPPFPTPNANSALFGSHNLVWQRPNTGFSETSGEADNQSLAPTEPESNSGSCEDSLWPFCQPLPAPSSTSSGTSEAESESSKPQWLVPLIGRLISNKACEASRKLRRKLSRGKISKAQR